MLFLFIFRAFFFGQAELINSLASMSSALP